LTCLLTSLFVYPQMIFDKSYGGVYEDIGNSVAQTYDGGYIITGSYQGSGSIDVYLIKTNMYGDTVWTKTFGGSGYDCGNSVIQTSDSGFVITGNTTSFGSGNADYYLIKTNMNGDLIWTKTYGGQNTDMGNSVIQTFDGGYIITGFTESFGVGNDDIFVVKTNANGDTLWTKTYGGSGDDVGRSIIQTFDSCYIICGFTNSVGAGDYDVYLIKTNNTGNTIWAKTFGGINLDDANSVKQTSDSGYIFVGCTQSFGAVWPYIYLIKTDAIGDTLWTRRFGGIHGEVGFSVALTNDGGYIIAGRLDYYGMGLPDLYLVKTNAYGDTSWTKKYGNAYSDGGLLAVQTTDGGYIACGYTMTSGTNYHDVYLIKTDANGIVGINNEISMPNISISIYPNPTINKITIKIPHQFGQTKTLEIYDRVGQLQLIKTDNFADTDIGALTSGLYFIVLTNVDNERLTSKIIKE